MSEADRRAMRFALALGRRNLGRTWPNPSVGAVVVAGEPGSERIVGQGVTAAAGSSIGTGSPGPPSVPSSALNSLASRKFL